MLTSASQKSIDCHASSLSFLLFMINSRLIELSPPSSASSPVLLAATVISLAVLAFVVLVEAFFLA